MLNGDISGGDSSGAEGMMGAVRSESFVLSSIFFYPFDFFAAISCPRQESESRQQCCTTSPRDNQNNIGKGDKTQPARREEGG